MRTTKQQIQRATADAQHYRWLVHHDSEALKQGIREKVTSAPTLIAGGVTGFLIGRHKADSSEREDQAQHYKRQEPCKTLQENDQVEVEIVKEERKKHSLNLLTLFSIVRMIMTYATNMDKGMSQGGAAQSNNTDISG